MTTRRIAPFLLAAPALLFGALWLHAGPLNPPAGPVASSYKTLSEVEPRIAINATNTPGDATSLFKITQPGSYYLTGNITGVSGKHGIAITTSGVSVDLNGFDLVGVPGMGAFDGISVTAVLVKNVTILHGSVRNWGGDGVDLSTFGANDCRLDGITASGNSLNGINTGVIGCILSNCNANSNTGIGIQGSTGSVITNCMATGNTGDGIATGNLCTISNCVAYGNHNGINTADGSTVTDCSAAANTSLGIWIGSNSTVTNCSSEGNTVDGIYCNSGCIIRGNACSTNGNNGGSGAGIHALGSSNRIEGNNCVLADRGIQVDGARNIIVRNSCSSNTSDWVFAAGNVFGPILDRTAPGSATVNGFTAASSLGTTDANANFSY